MRRPSRYSGRAVSRPWQNPPVTTSVSAEQVERLLNDELERPATGVTHIGAGAWSTCFGFRSNDEDLVIRLGQYREDFDTDRRAVIFARPGLPVPRLLEVGRGLDMFYAISSRAFGEALESTTDWEPLVTPVADMLVALRNADLSGTTGWGPWADSTAADEPLHGENASWREFLLAVNIDRPDWRTHGWMARLQASEHGDESFRRGYGLLTEMASDAVPRSLVHSDLMHRNVHVDGGNITGVFDWSCSLFGDHLYDLAWFEFWAPWYPAMPMAQIRDQLEQRWQASEETPHNMAERLATCHLHIGLSHLAYHAFQQSWDELAKVDQRMEQLINQVT